MHIDQIIISHWNYQTVTVKSTKTCNYMVWGRNWEWRTCQLRLKRAKNHVPDVFFHGILSIQQAWATAHSQFFINSFWILNMLYIHLSGQPFCAKLLVKNIYNPSAVSNFIQIQQKWWFFLGGDVMKYSWSLYVYK